MFNRIANILSRFTDLHYRLQGVGFDLVTPGGQHLGRVENLRWARGGLWLDGWTRAERITVRCRDAFSSTRPDRARPDVAAIFGEDLDDTRPTGFALRHSGRGQGPALMLDLKGGETIRLGIPCPALWRRGLARAALLRKMATVAVTALPLALRYAVRRDDRLRVELKRALRLDGLNAAHLLDPDLFGPAPPGPQAPEPITILLPVYNAFDLLPEVLERVQTHTDLPFHLVIIEDASPDERVRPFLRAAALRDARIELLENDRNLGFIGAVNRGLAGAVERGGHVVLLNSDAMVPPGWASRLLAPIHADAGVASVTPMSNDAEIFTTPVVCTRHDLAPGVADAIDEAARSLGGAVQATAPTGVGFCMAINEVFLSKLPELDTAFGRGYGEEVDWCQKARALGGRHVAQPRLFVEHRGGVSFGSTEKLQLVRENNAIITRRYPGYDREVQGFIQDDPLISNRMALGLAWLGATAGDRAVPIYLAHSLGGGADHWLERQLRRDLAEGPGVVILRVGGALRWRLELVTDAGRTEAFCADPKLVGRLLQPLRRRRVIYSCGVGDPDPVSLPDILLDLAGAGDRVELLLHDYYPISPSYTLLDHDDVFRGPVTASRDDLAHRTQRLDGTPVPLADWQSSWGRLVERADEVRVFSQAAADLMRAAYPNCTPVLRPHQLPRGFDPVDLPRNGPVTIATLGNLNIHKGAGVVAGLHRLARRRDVHVVVLGRIDPSLPMPGGLTVHGAYDPAQLPHLARRYGITHWLIPSIWPETFSFTTHEALATGLPVLGFDLGGQGEALRLAENGHPIPLDPSRDAARSVLDMLDALAPPMRVN
ncbi:glycosyltransferase [Aliiroseovarius sp.]|uniref:glycosyltransferase n=1 Tax=Aliiroseovarius sp. TaxID=1872442 RepID=UPI002602A1D3|nr:glycosyltransferase [Aliiroseovarius sp.]